ncbi:hypothetical protein [Rhizobium sp. YTU87027]|uniref:hypothetical protein n=1 Tax=Rhizobium sp. YTU87027 TaxID=3417741 RepID=UPI003D68BC3C
MQKIPVSLIAISLVAALSHSTAPAYAHGGGGKGRKMDCQTLAMQERNAVGGKLPSKDIKHREKIRRKMRKLGCSTDLG